MYGCKDRFSTGEEEVNCTYMYMYMYCFPSSGNVLPPIVYSDIISGVINFVVIYPS